jgi:hypothetical protein
MPTPVRFLCQHLRNGEQEQHAVSYVVDAVRVVLLGLGEDDGGAPPMLNGHAQVEHDHVQEEDHHLHHDGCHVGCCC